MPPTQSTTLRCPNCKYDVSQTLRDHITTCPECGHGITEGRCIRVYPADPIHIKLICRAIVFIAALAMTFAAFILLVDGEPIMTLLIAGGSLILLISPSFLRRRLPPEAPFPRVPSEYFIHYSGIVLFIAAGVFFVWFLIFAALRP